MVPAADPGLPQPALEQARTVVLSVFPAAPEKMLTIEPWPFSRVLVRTSTYGTPATYDGGKGGQFVVASEERGSRGAWCPLR